MGKTIPDWKVFIILEFIEANWVAFKQHCLDYNAYAEEIVKEIER